MFMSFANSRSFGIFLRQHGIINGMRVYSAQERECAWSNYFSSLLAMKSRNLASCSYRYKVHIILDQQLLLEVRV